MTARQRQSGQIRWLVRDYTGDYEVHDTKPTAWDTRMSGHCWDSEGRVRIYTARTWHRLYPHLKLRPGTDQKPLRIVQRFEALAEREADDDT